MNRLATQLVTFAVSILGGLTIIPGPNSAGKLRIPGNIGRIFAFIGIAALIFPWIVAPFLDQPRIQGKIGYICSIMGIACLVGGVVLYAISFKYLWPAFRKDYNEFNPASLITKGPYGIVRHPIYLALLIILIGLDILMRAIYTILMIPLLYVELKCVTFYEEKYILAKKFPKTYSEYKENVSRGIMGIGVGLALAILYIGIVGLAVFNFLGPG